MTLYVDTSCHCCLCTRADHMAVHDAERWTLAGAWEHFGDAGWQRHAHHKDGGMTRWIYVCPICSAKPDIVDRLRKRLKLEAAQPQGE